MWLFDAVVDGRRSCSLKSSIRKHSFASSYASLDGVNLDILVAFLMLVALTLLRQQDFFS
jgi:hypothetical protein